MDWWAWELDLRLSVGFGIVPTRRAFSDPLNVEALGCAQCWTVHRNPHFYKYRWWILTEADAVRDRFDRSWKDPGRAAATADAMAWIAALDRAGIRYFVFNDRMMRDDPSAPWDFPRLKSAGRLFAPALESDPDPPWRGHR